MKKLIVVWFNQEKTGLRKMALRKLALTALKEKHHILAMGNAFRSKVALLLILFCG